jgi:hypothetical protein
MNKITLTVIAILIVLMDDCFAQNDLETCFINSKQYNLLNYSDVGVLSKDRTRRVRINVGLLLGQNHKTLKLKFPYDDFTLHDTMGRYGGLLLNFRALEGKFDRFSLNLELLASEYYYYGGKNNFALNTPLIINYRPLNARIYPKIEIGLSGYLIRRENLQKQIITPVSGLSFNYEYRKSFRIFISSRIENNPRIFRFGGGFIF